MFVFFRCVVEAVAENGLKGLAEMVPGGPYVYAVAEGAWKKFRERCAIEAQQKELQRVLVASADEVRAEGRFIVREVLAAMPVVSTDSAACPPTVDEVNDLELFVSGIPDAVRQSLKRPDDPAGRSVPNGFALRSAEDVLKLLPARPARFRPGDALPSKSGWVLEQLLGMGGFGEVWFTRHARITSLSGAVKFCFGQSGRDLIHEAALIDRVMQAGRHPNIVPLVDVHLEGDRPWLLFEYVAGGNLTDWIHRLAGRPPVDRLPQVLAALRQLCDAVAYFHRLPVPIVHRDLKPSNILFDDATGRLRITDFGIGSITASETNRQESRQGRSRAGRLLSFLRGSCTPLYSSPQQRMGSDPDPRDDVHALGVIAFQMLTGKLDAAPGPRAGKVLKEAGVGREVRLLLLNCVSERVEDRPRHAEELLAKLPASLDLDGAAARLKQEAEAWRQREADLVREWQETEAWRQREAEVEREWQEKQARRQAEDEFRQEEERKRRAEEARRKAEARQRATAEEPVASPHRAGVSHPPERPAARLSEQLTRLGLGALRNSTDERPHLQAETGRQANETPASRKTSKLLLPQVGRPEDNLAPGNVTVLKWMPVAADQQSNSITPNGNPLVETEMRLAWIPRGTFQMGGNGRIDNPQHHVTVTRGFWIGVVPVTQAQWLSVMGYNPSHYKGNDCPVESVSCDDAQKFCLKLSDITRKPIRLPTEAEWEYACRAGSTGEYCSGTGIDALKAVGWYNGNSGNQTHSVGKLAANGWGLHDVHGNVWEWCQDVYGVIPASNQYDPLGQSYTQACVLRGGSWGSDPRSCLAAYRHWSLKDNCNNIYGLRICFNAGR